MATKEKLDSIAASKAAIKAAIQEKGVSCDDTLAEYANRIIAIPTGIKVVEAEFQLDFDLLTATTRPIYGLDEHSEMLLLLTANGCYPLPVIVPLLRDNPSVVFALTNELHTKYHLLRFNSFDYDMKRINFDILLVNQDIVDP